MGSGTIFRALTLFIATVLCCVGTGVSQIKIWNSTMRLYLYKITADGEKYDYNDLTEGSCNKYAQRFDAAYAFAIISCIVIGFAFITTALQLAGSSLAKIGKAAGTGLTAFGFITSLIAWAIVVGTFRADPCDMGPIKKAGGAIDTGCALLICTSGIMFVNLIASIAGFVGADEETASVSIFPGLRFVILFVATLFVCLGTGLPQLRIGEGASQLKFYLYQMTWGHGVGKLKDFVCEDEFHRRMRAAYAMAIVSCILLVLALIAVAVQFASSASAAAKPASVGLSVFGGITTLIAWAIVASTWYKDNVCTPMGGSLHSVEFKLSSGVILLVVGWILMIIDAIVGFISFSTKAVVAAKAAETSASV